MRVHRICLISWAIAALACHQGIGGSAGVGLPPQQIKEGHQSDFANFADVFETRRLEPLLTDLDVSALGGVHLKDKDDVANVATTDADRFWALCWERRPCLFRKYQKARHSDVHARQHHPYAGGLSGLSEMLTNTCGSWLIEELSTSKRSSCMHDNPTRAAGCSWRDSGTVLPASYFDGPQGQASLQSIRGTAAVQDDVVVGDTKSKTMAEQALLEYLRDLRGITRTRSFVGEAAKISGAEWISFAQDTNQTLILRDADGRSPELQALAASVRRWFTEPDQLPSQGPLYLTGSKKEPRGGMEVGISLYYTPPNCTSTVPPHIDTMDVLIVQEEGYKRWTVALPEDRYFLPPDAVRLPLTKAHYRHRRADGAGGGARYAQEVGLGPGDMLYVPRGVIHNTSTERHPLLQSLGAQTVAPVPGGSLHISIGLETDPSFTASNFILFASRYATVPHAVVQSCAGSAVDADGSSSLCGGDVDGLRGKDAVALLRAHLEAALWPHATEAASSWSRRDRDFLLLCVARALIHQATRRIVVLRRSIAIPLSACHQGAQVASEEGAANQGGDDCIGSHVRRMVERAAQGVLPMYGAEPAASGGTRRDRAVARRWRQLIQDTFGSASSLRGTSDTWWPPSVDGSEEEAGQLKFSPLFCGAAGTRLSTTERRALLLRLSTPSATMDMARVIDFMTNVVPDGLHRVMTEHVEPPGQTTETEPSGAVHASWRVFLDATMLWLLPDTTSARYMRCLWSEWVEEGLQEGHDARLAFQDWSWVNGVLLNTSSNRR